MRLFVRHFLRAEDKGSLVKKGERLMYDVIIIGGGVTGTACARELSRYQARICLLEKEEDLCCGTSKANSAIVHAGYDAAEGSLKARLNVRGNEKMEELSRQLDFPFRRNGSLVVCRREEEVPRLKALYDRGNKNGVRGLQLLNQEQVREKEPNVSDQVYAALYAPSAGIVCPFGMNIALGENAAANGVEFQFHTEVKEIRPLNQGWELLTSRGSFRTKYVINAAGVYADRLHNMVSSKKLHITVRRGSYCLLDHSAGNHVSHTVFALPGPYGKGILVAPTVHGNLLLGPTAQDTENREGTNTTREELDQILQKAGESVKGLPLRQVITSFAGLRAHEEGDDFVIGEPEDAPGFLDCAGIESPGLTAAPAIGEMVAEMLKEKLGLKEKDQVIWERKGILDPKTLDPEAYRQLLIQKPDYAVMVCRCEKISKGEILDAIRRPLGARSLDGIKRRTRAGMGRCQSGFCAPKVMEILAQELGIDLSEITKSGGNSRIITGSREEAAEKEGEQHGTI